MTTRLRLMWLCLALTLALTGCDDDASVQTDGQTAPAEAQDDEAPEETSDSEADEPKEPVIERSLLWRVDGDNGPLYLFGTIHGGVDADFDDLPLEVQQALDASKVVVLEADVDNVDPTAVAGQAMLPTDESLREKLGDEHWKKLTRHSTQSPMMLDLLQPWAAYMELARSWLGDGEPVDKIISARARQGDKELVYLETVEEQLGIVREAVTLELFREFLDEVEEHEEMTEQLIEAYKAGDAGRLEEVAMPEDQLGKYPELYEALFDQRNRAWVPKLEELLEGGGAFVAVGAGHLVGEASVNALLEERGHSVERVAAAEAEEADPAAAAAE
jgi:uncharacterized protein